MKELDLKQQGKLDRLTNNTFKFDSRIKNGWYSAVYFLKTSKIVEKVAPNDIVTMQFFQRHEGIVCGVDEAIALVHTFADHPSKLRIQALHDGDAIQPLEPVLKITGHYQDFGYLEGIIDGILARRTSVATNVYQAVKAAAPATVIFMGDRDDHYSNQQGDGYAAFIGGSAAQATHAMNEWWGIQGVGTMPHALIQIMNGDLIAACETYLQEYPTDNLIALVDFHNDVIPESLAVARHFQDKLYGIRVDTSQSMKDHFFDSFDYETAGIDPYGVNPTLIKALRKALDQEGFQAVKIIVSSGFTLKRIKEFNAENTPVDFYGIGSSLLKVNISFTGDLVNRNGVPFAKEGRHEINSERLVDVPFIDEVLK